MSDYGPVATVFSRFGRFLGLGGAFGFIAARNAAIVVFELFDLRQKILQGLISARFANLVQRFDRIGKFLSFGGGGAFDFGDFEYV